MFAQHRITAAVRRTSPAAIAVAAATALAAGACAPATGHPGNTGAGAPPAATSSSARTAGSATGRDPTPETKPAPGVASYPRRPASTIRSCAAEQRWGTQPRAGSTAMTAAPLYQVRAGRHGCYDRVVFDLNGPEPVGYTARYVPLVTADGSGAPVPVTGGAVLEIVVRAPIHGADGQGHQPGVSPPAIGEDLVAPARLAGWASLTQVAFAGSFEGQTTVAVGVRETRPFRIWTSSERHYRHVVLDIAR
jgi:hypothetical protein